MAHEASRGTYGARLVQAELVFGQGIIVGHGTVEPLMHRAGIKGLPGTRRPKPKHQTPTAGDLVKRQFTVQRPDQLDDGTVDLALPGWTPGPGGSWAGRSTARRPRAGDQCPGHGNPQP